MIKCKIYFVEIKQVNLRQRRKARTEATGQLHAAIRYFSAHFATQAAPSRLIMVIYLKAKQAYPVQNATRSADRLAFF